MGFLRAIALKAVGRHSALVASNKRLIEIFEEKIQSKIGEVWGTFDTPARKRATQ